MRRSEGLVARMRAPRSMSAVAARVVEGGGRARSRASVSSAEVTRVKAKAI